MNNTIYSRENKWIIKLNKYAFKWYIFYDVRGGEIFYAVEKITQVVDTPAFYLFYWCILERTPSIGTQDFYIFQ